MRRRAGGWVGGWAAGAASLRVGEEGKPPFPPQKSPPGKGGRSGESEARASEGVTWPSRRPEEPVLLAELKPGRPQRYDWKSSCETWSVAFSPDGAWFAWSQGHCVVKLIPWPLEEAEL